MVRPSRLYAPVGALFLTLLLGTTIGGCDSSNALSGPATVRLDAESLVGGAAFQAGQPFPVDGRTGQFDIARFYVSGITMPTKTAARSPS